MYPNPSFIFDMLTIATKNTPVKQASYRFFSSSQAAYAKKKTIKKEETEKAILGRPSNNLRMGVVGLPNIG